MLGLVVLLLAIAIPLGIVALTVTATEAERKLFDHTPVSRRYCAFVFAVAALLAVLWVFRGTGPEYSPAIGLFLGIPAAVIAALIAAASHRFLVGRSKVGASITGVTITILTALSTSTLFAVFFAPSHSTPISRLLGSSWFCRQAAFLRCSLAASPACYSVIFPTVSGLTIKVRS